MPEHPAGGGQTLAELGELAVIRALEPYLAAGGDALEVGPGDDAAIWLPPVGRSVVVTSDSLVEDVHFHFLDDEASMVDLGWKLLAVSLSDLAAMAAEPGPAVLSLALPGTWQLSHLLALYSGLSDCAQEYGAQLAGGNFSSAATAVLTCTCLGSVSPSQALRRVPVEAGWMLAVTGEVGGAAAALRMLREDGMPGAAAVDAAVFAPWLRRLRRPQPRLAAAAAVVASGVGTALDVSDGIFHDAARLLQGSATGCCFVADAIPVAAGIRARWPGDWAALAGGGEDYELLFAGPQAAVENAIAAVAATGLTAHIVATFDHGDGVRIKDGGVEVPVSGGHQHFG